MSEQETRMFWRFAQDLRRATARNDAAGIAEALDEIEVLRIYTENPLLASRYDEALVQNKAVKTVRL